MLDNVWRAGYFLRAYCESGEYEHYLGTQAGKRASRVESMVEKILRLIRGPGSQQGEDVVGRVGLV